MQPPLFDTDEPESAGSYVLWYKPPTRRARWRKVGTGRTHYEAVLLMAGSGAFMVIEGGGHPTGDRAARAQPGATDGARSGASPRAPGGRGETVARVSI